MTFTPSDRGTRPRTLGPVLVLLMLGLMLPACRSDADLASASASSPSPGRAASGTRAPDFSLTDQFGDPAHLSDFRGRVVLLTFIDSHCSTICPLTAELMTRTEQTLGSRYPVQLLAINANPDFTSVSDVREWSIRHRMLRRWLFLTGSVGQLKAVWSSYGIQARVVQGDVAHTAVIFVIDAVGNTRSLVPIAQGRGIDAEAVSIARAIRTLSANGT
jgi:cytochrome oxidase Cu insertion factor (SCO1/SenC/PrrC family)